MARQRYLAAVVLALAGCSIPEERQQIRIMDDVERTIRLPPGSLRLNDYSRYYAEQSSGKVAVLYVVHSASHIKYMQDLCSREPTNTFPCSENGRLRLVPPGGRLWLADSRDLPSMDGGGCGNLQFTYDPASKALPTPRCNGPY